MPGPERALDIIGDETGSARARSGAGLGSTVTIPLLIAGGGWRRGWSPCV